jgi:hypothetical protein
MNDPIVIVRAAAARLNPLIDGACQADTLANCAAVLRAMSVAAGEYPKDHERPDGVYLLLITVSAALDFESGAPGGPPKP